MPTPRSPADRDKVSAAIARSDMTQRQLARELDVSEVTVSNYVTKWRSPSAGNLSKLARALGVDVRDLMHDPV